MTEAGRISDDPLALRNLRAEGAVIRPAKTGAPQRGGPKDEIRGEIGSVMIVEEIAANPRRWEME